MGRFFLMIALTLALCPAAFTQVPQERSTPAETITARVDQLFAQWDKPDTPGYAVAVIKDGQIIYKRGYGMASLQLAAPITPSTVFKVGSIAKQFTAMSILMLEHQGKLSLDDDATRRLNKRGFQAGVFRGKAVRPSLRASVNSGVRHYLA